MENEKDREANAGKASGVVPTQLLAQVSHRENGEDGERDYFLDGFELSGAEFERANAICGNLEAVFEKGDAPTGENNFPESLAAVFEMAVPSERHEDVGDGQKKNGPHERSPPVTNDLDVLSILRVSDQEQKATGPNSFGEVFHGTPIVYSAHARTIEKDSSRRVCTLTL